MHPLTHVCLVVTCSLSLTTICLAYSICCGVQNFLSGKWPGPVANTHLSATLRRHSTAPPGTEFFSACCRHAALFFSAFSARAADTPHFQHRGHAHCQRSSTASALGPAAARSPCCAKSAESTFLIAHPICPGRPFHVLAQKRHALLGCPA